MQDAKPLRITVRDLSACLDDPTVRLIDARPPKEYEEGHVSGALNFDPFPPYATTDTSADGLAAFFETIREVFGRLGIAPDSRVICYDATSGARSSRIVWLLHTLGHGNAVIVDGGVQQWRDAGHPLVTDLPSVSPTTFTPSIDEAHLANFETVLEGISDSQVVLWDVRSSEEYYGEKVRAKRGGAIPGSIHYEWTENLDEHGGFKDLDVMRRNLEALGITPDKRIIPY